MKSNIDGAIKRAKELLIKADASHGLDHAERVLEYALKIAQAHEEADLEVLEIACWWHDVGRISGDRNHPRASAILVEAELPSFGFVPDFIQEVREAISNHSSHAVIEPSNIEGKILKDADKLEYITPERWRRGTQENFFLYFDPAIEGIPKIRNNMLFFDESKALYDELLSELKDYAKSEKSLGFAKYRDRILSLEPLK